MSRYVVYRQSRRKILSTFLASPQCLARCGREASNADVAWSSWRTKASCRDLPKARRSRPLRNLRDAATTPVFPRPRTVEAPTAIFAARLWIARSSSVFFICPSLDSFCALAARCFSRFCGETAARRREYPSSMNIDPARSRTSPIHHYGKIEHHNVKIEKPKSIHKAL
ncbi:MAG: hypothetical protein KatS3mg105_0460 [Gemmatales bacterium]|nr:MAG: hypothetical protein KatS3mg105_0460 [Gemmatales bacterium]